MPLPERVSDELKDLLLIAFSVFGFAVIMLIIAWLIH